MRRFLLVFLSLQILFNYLSASSSEDWDYDEEDVWEYLLGDWDYEFNDEYFDHNTLEPQYDFIQENTAPFQLAASCDPKKSNHDEPNLALMTLEAPPASRVAGCVSAISGAFVDAHIGLTTHGFLPLTVQCTYCSSDKKWSFKHKPKLRASLSGGGNHLIFGYMDDQGSGIPFRSYLDKKNTSFFIPPSVFEKGVSNCGSGEICGKTNLKNTRLHFVRNEYGKCYSLLTGSGINRIFSYVKGGEKHRKGAPLGKFCLREEWLPNGNKVKYSYNDSNKLSMITPFAGENSQEGLEIIEFSPLQTNWKSDSSQVSYIFEHDQKKLKEIEPTHAIPVSYNYNSDDRVIKKILPEGRFLQISYSDLNDNWHRKPVRMLCAPVGENDEPVCTHKFTYGKDTHPTVQLKNNKLTLENIGFHVTTVEDAAGNKTIYTYGDKNKRLHSIKKLEGNQPYIYERFIWSAAGNLKSRYFQGEGKVYFSRAYEYDKFGNVVQEWLWGNLTGKNETSLHVNLNGKPENGNCEVSCEVFSKKRTFNKSLLLTEDDGRKSISCTYYDNSNLLKSRFTFDGPGINSSEDLGKQEKGKKDRSKKTLNPQNTVSLNVLKREFFEYEYGVLVKEVWDDGTSTNPDDRANVTERHERKTTLNPIGLPEMVAEYCNERLVKKQVNSFSPQGLLIKQEHYGSDNSLAYTLYWDYDTLGNVIKEVNALGEESLFSHDANGNKIFEQGPSSELCKRYSYDFANRLIKEEEIWNDGRHFITSHRYNTLNQRIATTDIFGNETHFTYDSLGRVIEKQLPCVNSVIPIEKFQYDPMGNIIAQWDANGNCTKRKCTIRGNPYQIEYPDGSVEKKYYTLDGLLECEIAKNGLVKTYKYDALGRVTHTQIKDPAGVVLKTTSSTYNTFHLISETDELGLTTYYTYDWAGRCSSMTKGDHITHYRYDSLGRNVETIEMDRVSIKEYDLLDRVIEERIEGNGEVLKKEQFIYDVQGNRTHQISFTHAGKAITQTTYLSNGEPQAITDALGNTTHIDNDYAFIHQGQCVRCTTTSDSLGNQEIKIYDTHQRVCCLMHRNSCGQIIQSETYTYDLVGHKTATHATVYFTDQEPHTITTEWQYDCMGNITCCIEAKGTNEQKTTRHRYNQFGQKELSELPNGITLKFSYDDLGLLKTYSSSDGTISYSYTYDIKNQPVLIEDHVQGTIATRVYDIYGRLIHESQDHGQTISTTYDALDRPISITLPDQTTIQYQYNALYLIAASRGHYIHRYENYDLAGNVSLEHLAGQAGTIKTTYDLLERPISTVSPHRQESLLDFDAVGNLLKRRVNNEDYRYTYDDLYQLASETGTQNHTYASDSLYNRRSKDCKTYATNDLNQLLHQTEWSYHYDANGNLTLKSSENESISYSYDALDRLIEVKTGSSKTTYTYDSFHRRLTKTKSGHTTHFLYYGQNEIGTISNGKIDELRVLGLTHGAEIGAAVLLELHGKTYIPLHDSFGNVATLLDPSGHLLQSYDYSAFGEMESFDNPNPWLFSSKRLDPETGFFFFGRRYYAPDIGRFITPDPLGFEDGPNLYTYVHNRPLVYIDPDGQLAFLLPLASLLAPTLIGMAAEACLPMAVATLGQSATGIACAAFLTGVVKGYNGSVLEGNTFDSAGPVASLCEYGGKAIGTAISCTNPKAILNGGSKVLAHIATKEGVHIAEKVITQKAAQVITSNVSKKAINQSAKNAANQTTQKAIQLSNGQFGKNSSWRFPENPKELLKGLSRDHRGRIYPCENLRIRPEKHVFEPGDIYCPRHHRQHYHVEMLKKGGSWNNKNHVGKLLPNGYNPGDGTGFLPGEFFPGVK